MSESVPVPPAAGPAAPARILRMSRGFSALFWGLPLLSAAHALALLAVVPVRWLSLAYPASFLPVAWGLWMLPRDGEWTPHWHGKLGRAWLWTLAAFYLSPFAVWWPQVPLRIYFAVNAAAHYAATLGLLVALNRLAGAAARGLGDAALKREALAGTGMVLWLSGCTVGALAWMFHRAGLFEAGLATVLLRIAGLPAEARTLLLLPYAMTAYVMWRAKEAGFRLAAEPDRG